MRETMKTGIFIKIILSLLLINAMLISTQAQEESVPFDSKNKLYKLTPEINRKIGFYNGEGTFKEASLFKENDSVYIAEILFVKENKVYRKRQQISQKEFVSIQNRIDVTLSEIAVTYDAKEGRTLLLGTTTLAGMTLYGGSAVEMANFQNGYNSTGLYMLTAGASFFVPYLLTKDQPVSYGQANLVYYGLSRGFGHGVMLGFLVDKNASSQKIFTYAFATGVTEAVGGFNLVKYLKINNGTANLMTIYGDYGMLMGLGLALQFDYRGDNPRPYLGMTLLGGFVGEALGYYLGKDNNISAGDAEIIGATGNLGAYIPLVVADIVRPNDYRFYTTPAMMGGLIGLYVGNQLVKNYDFSFSQGFLTRLGTNAGGLVGLGLTYFILQGRDVRGAYLLGNYLGAQASFYILYKMNLRTIKSETLSKFDFKFHPENIFLSKSLKSGDPHIQAMMPFATLSYKLD